MKKCVSWFIVLLLSLFLTTVVSAEIIDFESLATSGDIVYYGNSYEEDGFLLTGQASDDDPFDPEFAVWGTDSFFYPGSTMLFLDNYEGLTTMTRSDGGYFSVSSIDLAELYPDDASPFSFDVSFSGLLADGSSVDTLFNIDGKSGVQTFSFNSDFSNVLSVSWIQTGGYFQVDNIDTNPVPEPSSMLLLGFGLLGLAGATRRKLK